MISVSIIGAAGKMGRAVARIILQECDDIQIVGALEAENSSRLGEDVGLGAGLERCGVTITSNISAALEHASVSVDFSEPEATLETARFASSANVASVVGTTGLTPHQRDEMAGLASKVPMVLAPNMSVGVNLLFKLVRDVTVILGKDYDVEMFEIHHRFKKDAPSGTAVRLGEIIADVRGLSMDDHGIFGRKGIIGERNKGEIGIMTLRGGDVVGEHTVVYAGIGERIELTHRAHSRETFVRGAIRAVRWIQGKSPGLYDMGDVLGIG